MPGIGMEEFFHHDQSDAKQLWLDIGFTITRTYFRLRDFTPK